MIVAAFDPGPKLTGWARVEVRGGGSYPIAVTFLGGGKCASTPDGIHAQLTRPLDMVAIEVVKGIAYIGKGPGIVDALVGTADVAGMIRGIAWREQLRTAELTARDWRGLVCGNPSATDAKIKDVVEKLVHGVPRTNVHVRDALGLALGVAWHTSGGRILP